VRNFWAISLALLATACGGPALVADLGGDAAPAGSAAPRTYAADPRGWSRAEILARSAEVLAEAAGDGSTVDRFTAFAAGPDPDPAGTREIARQALGRLVKRDPERRGAGQGAALAADRAKVEAIASGRVAPATAPAREPIAFPRDEGAHWDALTEWWYLNGHLAGGAERFGFEFTLFRVGPLLYFAHVALTDETGKRFHYVREWYTPGKTASADKALDVRYGPHRIHATAPGAYAMTGVAGKGTGFDLQLASRKQPMLINGDGNIDMPEGKDSRYYSLTRMDAGGTVTVGGRRLAVTGLVWLDHQWGPFYVSGFKERWDWFSVQLDDGTDYNLFAFRAADGTPLARHVNKLDARGAYRGGGRLELGRDTWWQSPRTGLRYTTRWTLDLPDAGERIAVETVLPEQEVARYFAFPIDPLPQYWEGRMRATKTRADASRSGGVAYCETFGF